MELPKNITQIGEATLQSSSGGRLCGILHKTNERNGTEQRHCHCAVWQTDDGEYASSRPAHGSAKLNFLQKPIRNHPRTDGRSRSREEVLKMMT